MRLDSTTVIKKIWAWLFSVNWREIMLAYHISIDFPLQKVLIHHSMFWFTTHATIILSCRNLSPGSHHRSEHWPQSFDTPLRHIQNVMVIRQLLHIPQPTIKRYQIGLFALGTNYWFSQNTTTWCSILLTKIYWLMTPDP